MTDQDSHALPVERSTDDIVTLHLTPNPARPRGGVVVLDSWLLDAIDEAMDRIAGFGDIKGFILASDSERVFVAGADLAEIDALDDDALLAYLARGAAVYQRIADLPCPTVAAVNGACLGGGLEIAMHCDVLVSAVVSPDDKPWRIGLPEAGLGLCPGWGGTQMLPARIDPATAIAATASGTTFKATEIPDGLVEVSVPRRDLLDAPHCHLALRVRRRRRALEQVARAVDREVAADRAERRLRRVGVAGERLHRRRLRVPHQHHRRPGDEEVDERGEVRGFFQGLVVRRRLLARRLQHLARHQRQAALLEALRDLEREAARDGVGLEEDERRHFASWHV